MLKLQRGDTIIEVLLAFTVFSMVSVGTMTVMGQGTNASQRALEITLVRQQIDAQAEALRAAHQAYSSSGSPDTSEWKKFAIAGSSHYANSNACPAEQVDIPNSFLINPKNGEVATGNWLKNIATSTEYPYAHVKQNGATTESYGIWIERTYKPGGNAPGSYDFDIRACWYGAGLSNETPMQIETTVRLYEPRS